MGKKIADANQKGGVGKTTTCINLCAALKKRNRRVLLADCDPQGNSTSGMGVSKDRLPNIYDLLIRGTALSECVAETPYGDVLPANRELSGATVELVDMESREFVLKTALLPAREQYDYILIDCMPSLGMITINAFACADSILIPVQAAYLPVKGLEQLIKTIGKVKRQINPRLGIEGILLTMVDSRTNYARDISALLKESYGSKVRIFENCIPISVRAAEISAEGVSIYQHDPKGKVAMAYQSLTEEVLGDE